MYCKIRKCVVLNVKNWIDLSCEICFVFSVTTSSAINEAFKHTTGKLGILTTESWKNTNYNILASVVYCWQNRTYDGYKLIYLSSNVNILIYLNYGLLPIVDQTINDTVFYAVCNDTIWRLHELFQRYMTYFEEFKDTCLTLRSSKIHALLWGVQRYMPYFEEFKDTWLTLRSSKIHALLWGVQRYMTYFEEFKDTWLTLRSSKIHDLRWGVQRYMPYFEEFKDTWLTSRSSKIHALLWGVQRYMTYFEEFKDTWLTLRSKDDGISIIRYICGGWLSERCLRVATTSRKQGCRDDTISTTRGQL